MPAARNILAKGLPVAAKREPFASRAVTREGRLKLLVEIRDAARERRLPDSDAAIFFDAVITGWLSGGGDLVAEHLRVSAPRGSHFTAQWIYQNVLIGDEPQSDSIQEYSEHDSLRE